MGIHTIPGLLKAIWFISDIQFLNKNIKKSFKRLKESLIENSGYEIRKDKQNRRLSDTH